MNDILDGYGPQKDLQEILEELVTWCSQQSVSKEKPDITVILPKAIVDNYSLTFRAKERIVAGTPTTETPKISALWFNPGIVNILSEEEYLVVTRASTERPG